MTLREPAVSALGRLARGVTAALRALSRASFPVLLVALVRANDPPITTAVLAEALVALALVPELCARLVLRAFAAEVHVDSGALRISGALRRVEVPLSSLARARAWRVPLPTPGLALDLRSGARLPIALATRDPERVLPAPAPERDAALAYARARGAEPRRWWEHPLVAVGLASLAPAAVAFYAHQHIAYGALLGEYYLMGARAWLATALQYAFTSALYLVIWWGCFRIAVEMAAWLGAQASPGRAAAVRRIAARTAAGVYYASIPALLAARFLA